MRLLEKWFEPAIIVAMLGAIIAFVFADVIARFAFSTSVAVANELARFCFVYMIYFGVSYGIRERRHMRVTLFVDMLPEAGRRRAFILSELVFLAYSVMVTWQGIVITGNAVERGKIMSSTEWSLGVLYFAIILSGALCCLRLLQSLKRAIVDGDIALNARAEH